MSRSSATCPTCSSTLVEIQLAGDLTMRSCSRCERRWWQQGAGEAELTEVLAAVAVSGGKRRPATV